MFKIILYYLKVYSNHSKEERLTFLLESLQKKSVSFFSELENWNTVSYVGRTLTKLAYWRGYLSDAAFGAIQGPSAVDEDHELALQQLKGRVDQSLVAVQKHALMIIQSVSSNNKRLVICDILCKERDQGGLSRKETDQPCRWMNERKSKPEEQLPFITVENSFLSAGRNNLTVTESAGRQTLGRDTEWRDETASVSIVLSTGCVRQSVSADTEIRDHPSVRIEDVSSVGREDIRRPDCRRLWLDLMGPWTSDNSELPAGLSIEALFIKLDVAKALDQWGLVDGFLLLFRRMDSFSVHSISMELYTVANKDAFFTVQVDSSVAQTIEHSS
ncbi:hypothetical protein D917_00747 [Trichinella nativa]|uniref:Uncharacterized protein n=1 Tax=Trichinella nativa TaxID=6335 RepID=A0A1Y3E555_9BILA|nr:hypothetical protein D917_00747 [Trichinella nativa]